MLAFSLTKSLSGLCNSHSFLYGKHNLKGFFSNRSRFILFSAHIFFIAWVAFGFYCSFKSSSCLTVVVFDDFRAFRSCLLIKNTCKNGWKDWSCPFFALATGPQFDIPVTQSLNHQEKHYHFQCAVISVIDWVTIHSDYRLRERAEALVA